MITEVISSVISQEKKIDGDFGKAIKPPNIPQLTNQSTNRYIKPILFINKKGKLQKYKVTDGSQMYYNT
jgi:hypothetical protein